MAWATWPASDVVLVILHGHIIGFAQHVGDDAELGAQLFLMSGQT